MKYIEKLYINSISISFLVITLIGSCSRDTSRGGSIIHEYVSGGVSYSDTLASGGISTKTYPAIWVDRVLTPLSTSFEGYAEKVVRVGSDVYVGGNLKLNNLGISEAVIWKNGEVIRLSPGNRSYVIDILVVGSDVYAVGYRFGVGATMWKNGIETYLPSSIGLTTTGEAVSIVKSENGDIIIGGFDYGVNQDAFPIIWKNGIPNRINERYYVTQDVYSFQGDTYTLTRPSPGAASNNCSLWKNNTKISSYENGDDLYSLLIDSEGIKHFIGQKFTAQSIIASYWKENTHYNLGFEGYSYGIASLNAAIYVCGQTDNIGGVASYKPFVWVNNQVNYLQVPSTSSGGGASDIFIYQD